MAAAHAPIAHSLRTARAYAEVHQDEERHHHHGGSPNKTNTPAPSTSSSASTSKLGKPSKKQHRDTASIEYEAVTIKPAEVTEVEMQLVTKDGDASKKVKNNNNSKLGTSIFPLIQTPPNIDLTGREVVLAIAVFFFLSVSVGLIVVLVEDRMTQQRQVENVTRGECKTIDCLQTSLRVLQSGKFSVDPCDDMWSYSCGGWLDKTDIPDNRDSWDITAEIKQKVQRQLLELLREPQDGSMSSATAKTKHMFNKCIDSAGIEQQGVNPLKKLMEELGGWALSDNQNTSAKCEEWNFARVLGEVNFKLFVRPFFVVNYGPLMPDQSCGNLTPIQSSSHNLIHLLKYHLTISNHSVYLDTSSNTSGVMRAYREYLTTVALLYGASENKTNDFVDAIIQFETRLAGLFEHEGNSTSTMNVYTLAQLQNLSPQIAWLEFFTSGLPFVTNATQILVHNESYFVQLSDILGTTDKCVLNYYILWRVFDELASGLLSKPFTDARDKFNAVLKPETKRKNRESYCMEVVNESFGKALGAMYVKRHFPLSSKLEVESIAENIKLAFYSVVNSSQWLSKETADMLLREIENLNYTVGYVDWMANDDLVDRHYENLRINMNDSYFDIIVKRNRYDFSKLAHELENNIAAEDWAWSPHEVGAQYSPLSHQLVIPAGLLQPPIYTANVPSYMNYASVGAIIGHEMTHPFNDLSKFCFDDHSKSIFDDRRRCYSDHYTRMKLHVPETKETWSSNGSKTIDEDFADINGINIAFQAFHSVEKTQERLEHVLPALNFTANQAFFLAFGQMWCTKRRADVAVDILNKKHTSMHAAPEMRLSGTLSNTKEYLDSFNCKKRDAMYPVGKCLAMWQ